MSSILQDIESQIAGVKTSVTRQNVGVVREIGDGVAKVEGLTDAMYNEMLDFGDGVTGLVLNLEETEVGAIILGDYTGIKEGQEVHTTGKVLQVPVGMELLGRVVNTLGQPVDDKGPTQTDKTYPVEKIAPGIIRRKSVSQPVQTGIMAIDAMIPIGRGQRELIIGDRQTGKTTIAIDAIINQRTVSYTHLDVYKRQGQHCAIEHLVFAGRPRHTLRASRVVEVGVRVNQGEVGRFGRPTGRGPEG